MQRQMSASVYDGGAVSRPVKDNETYMRELLARMVVSHERISRLAFDRTHPVDEYISSPGIPGPNSADSVPAPYTLGVQLTPTWEIPERIDSILVTVPAGVTCAALLLGDRVIGLYGSATAAAALPEPTTYSFEPVGMILNRDDNRLLALIGTPTIGPTHFELMGFADEIYGNA